jgi:tryptophan-rich sensory protein
MMKKNYFIIPVLIFFPMLLGGFLCRGGMNWYNSLALPAITPPNWVFSPIWTIIFFLTAWFTLVVWNSFIRNERFYMIISLLAVNLVLNTAWTCLFFGHHLIGWALVDAIALTITTYGLILLAAPVSWSVACLLVPYAAWGTFACYLNYLIWVMN